MANPGEVTLTDIEITMASIAGTIRFLEARKKHLRDKDFHRKEGGDSGTVLGLANDIASCIGEAAFAKYINRYWGGPEGTYKMPDVGKVQVRWTEFNYGKLIIRPDDGDNDIFALVTGMLPTLCIRGYLRRGSDGKNPQWERDPGNKGKAWFVPQEALLPVRSVERR